MPREKGIVSITFDDGYLTQYENAFSLMQKYNYTGTLYLVVNKTHFSEVDGREMMNKENVLEMQNAGWEIGAHTVSHEGLESLTEEERLYQIEFPLEYFEYYEIEIESLAYPYGEHFQFKSMIKRHYTSARTMKHGYNDLNNLHLYRLESKAITVEHTVEEICDWIKNTNENQWLILGFHSVEEEKERFHDISIYEFEQILKCIKESGLRVENVNTVINEYA